jgi:hypothetical protein
MEGFHFILQIGFTMGFADQPVRQMMAVLALLIGCAFHAESYAASGQVIDQATDKPIAGAIVVVSWNATSGGPGGASSQCTHLETTTTDAQGRYRIPIWTGAWFGRHLLMFDKYISYSAYLLGYIDADDPRTTEERIYLTPFVGTKDSWFAQFRTGKFFCTSNTDDSSSNLQLLLTTMASDMEAIARTERQKKIARFVRNRANEEARYGRSEAGTTDASHRVPRSENNNVVVEPKWIFEEGTDESIEQPADKSSTMTSHSRHTEGIQLSVPQDFFKPPPGEAKK